MRPNYRLSISLLFLWIALALGPVPAKAQKTAAPAFVENLISEPGPTFTVSDRELPKNPTILVYGDMRFTDPADTDEANPQARRLLADKVASEHPDAVIVAGDVPYRGADPKDYQEFKTETAAWRAVKLRLYPAIGNHEIAGGTATSGDPVLNWWATFPELSNRRWYSVQFGKRIYLLNLDSTLNLMEGSRQTMWLQDQIQHLPKSVQFVFISLHHPPVADIQTRFEVDHNPRPNEIALRDYLSKVAPQSRAKFVVAAGHMHNYERHELDGVTYLVSGGGGAHPYQIDRTPDDLYQGTDVVNFHYVLFRLEGKELRATMIRLDDPSATTPIWQKKDTFVITAR